MKIRVLFRTIQEVPVENRERQKELEHQSDLEALRLGIPLPPVTGPLPVTATTLHGSTNGNLNPLRSLPA